MLITAKSHEIYSIKLVDTLVMINMKNESFTMDTYIMRYGSSTIPVHILYIADV